MTLAHILRDSAFKGLYTHLLYRVDFPLSSCVPGTGTKGLVDHTLLTCEEQEPADHQCDHGQVEEGVTVRDRGPWQAVVSGFCPDKKCSGAKGY